MNTLTTIIQVAISLGILNVWLLRFNQQTSWRGGEAQNMREEFQAYGLPTWCVGAIGFLKVLFAILFLVGVWFPTITMPATSGLAILMLGAIAMHVKIKDPLKKSLPALSVLLLCLIVVL